MVTIEQIRDAVSRIAPLYDIKSVRLFGSYAENRAREDSDIDLLVEYTQEPVSLLQIFGFREEISEELEKAVDVLKYPPQNLVFPNFEIKKVVDVYEQ